MPTITDLAKSYVRTIVPVVVGFLLTLAIKHGVDLSAYTGAVTVAVTVAYYAGARLLERYVSPKFGWLLGLAAAPTYSPSALPVIIQDWQHQPIQAHLDALPAATGRKGGALPSPHDDRDYRAPLPTRIPASIDYGAGITWGMLLNDRIGDCYPVALLHALQVITGYVPQDADALVIYEQVTGYDPSRTDAQGNNPTDRGTAGRPLFDWARKQGLIGSYAAVPPIRAAVKAAITAHVAVLCEWALPIGAETEGDTWTMPRRNRAAGSWGGHATVEVGYTPGRNRNVTWGEEGTVTPPFEDAYLQAAWVITVPPGADVAGIMARVRGDVVSSSLGAAA